MSTWFHRLLLASLPPAVLLATTLRGGEGPLPARPEAVRNPAQSAPETGTVEIRFNDGSVLKLALRDERIEVLTPYGKLLIPVADIHRIDFATRIAEAYARRIDAAIANLGNAEYTVREAATAELLKLREKAYPALLRVAKHQDPEVARRVDGLLEKIRDSVPEEQLEIRPYDVITTEHSKIAGRISGTALKADTAQFGEVQVKLSDVRILRSALAAIEETEAKDAPTGPDNMVALQNQLGRTFVFKVTGALGGAAPVLGAGGGGLVRVGQGGGVWGTELYTADSALAVAAVHAGVLRPGQTGLIKVKMVPPPPLYEGSTRNGVTSSPYGNYPAAYRISK
jgi:hypothetical protein